MGKNMSLGMTMFFGFSKGIFRSSAVINQPRVPRGLCPKIDLENEDFRMSPLNPRRQTNLFLIEWYDNSRTRCDPRSAP